VKNLQGQVAIISGGLGDIGRATASELARRGADVAVSDIRPAGDAEPYLRSLRDLGVRAVYHKVDVRDADAVAAWIDDVARQLGATPSLVIVNAAQVTAVNLRSMTPQQWAAEIRVNLDGAFYMAHAAALRLVAAKKPGRIVFLGSVAAHIANFNIPAYCAAKAGVRQLCRVMAYEFAGDGILVNEIAPGYVDAGLSAKVWDENPGSRELAAADVPNRLLISADEVAKQIAYLCDPENRQITGATLLMDGGLSLTVLKKG
jgi:NAD(P)-dependent dehydrogenase (short-subunit alcohol dehydrogenase family)